ncbi:MAG: 4Fe-4S dicluster domain-containing protein [Crenarchaeota archaeon]|nr:4Fe-4S dicluster domain-containing protein [Thermoproteota archaeon]
MSFLKVLAVAAKRGRATIRYPLEPPLVTPFFRGKISVDPSKCIGCGACARICPPRAIELVREDNRFVLRYFIGRCIFCGMCADTCPQQAIEVSHEFELATPRLEDLYEEVIHRPATCSVCGEPYLPRKLVEKAIESSGMEVARERLEMCPQCRRISTAQVIASSRLRFGSDLLEAGEVEERRS